MIQFTLTPEQPFQLKVLPQIIKRISRDISQKLSGCLLSLAGLKEVLNTVEVFMIIEHEEVLILLALRQVLQFLHRI